jgi:branched-chain amino acid transport system ATP-binding protein
MSPVALAVEDLSTGYAKTQILRKVTMRVEEGNCVGLLGPNGHGKTTLMRTISGLHPAWSGSVRLRGKDILGLSPRERVAHGVVLVPQDNLLFGDLTVDEHLIISVHKLKRRDRRATIRQTYELLPQLGARRKQLARVLSGGEKRMLAIARGVILEGSVFLIDEPSLGLSPRMSEVVYGHIRELSERGKTILIVEENPGRLRGLASHVYLLDRGVVVAQGLTEEVLRNESLLQTYLGVGQRE